MPKVKRKREAKAERQKKYKWIFINGKQVRVKREPTIEGVPVDQFIRENADPIFLHQNEMWEYMDEYQVDDQTNNAEDEEYRSNDVCPF